MALCQASINDVSVTEGGSVVLTVTKTGSTSSSFSINYATADGIAAGGSDYTASSGTLTFAAVDTTKTITIATIDDTAVESAETVLVNLSGLPAAPRSATRRVSARLRTTTRRRRRRHLRSPVTQ